MGAGDGCPGGVAAQAGLSAVRVRGDAGPRARADLDNLSAHPLANGAGHQVGLGLLVKPRAGYVRDGMAISGSDDTQFVSWAFPGPLRASPQGIRAAP